MMARLQIGEVLLTTGIDDVLREVSIAIVPRYSPLPHQLTEEHPVHFREFGGLSQ